MNAALRPPRRTPPAALAALPKPPRRGSPIALEVYAEEIQPDIQQEPEPGIFPLCGGLTVFVRRSNSLVANFSMQGQIDSPEHAESLAKEKLGGEINLVCIAAVRPGNPNLTLPYVARPSDPLVTELKESFLRINAACNALGFKK